MSRISGGIRRKYVRLRKLACLLTAVLLCGCGKQEITKTVILPDTDAKKSTGINVKNIQEYTCEEPVVDMTWSREGTGNLCLVREAGGEYIYQKVNVYQKTVSDEIVFADYRSDFVKIAPGGGYIAFGMFEDDVWRLYVCDVDRKESELLMEWGDEVSTGNPVWSGDGMKFFIWMITTEEVQDQDISGESNIYCFDMESEERMKSQIQLPVPANGAMWENMLPNEDGSRIFAREEYFDSREGENVSASVYMEENEERKEGFAAAEDERKDWLFDMETGETEEIDLAGLNIRSPVKYTDLGLFGTEGDKLWFVREPLKEASGKRLLEEEWVDICICEKGDHVFLIGREEHTDYLQVTGILLEDGEIQEYQALYKGIYGEYGQSFIGMDDHELVIRSIGYEENDRWTFKTTVLEY